MHERLPPILSHTHTLDCPFYTYQHSGIGYLTDDIDDLAL